MSWSEADIPDQLGRVAVVTGANGGLGLETARSLAAKRAHVVMAARNQDKAVDAMAFIGDTVPEASVELRELDLGSLDSVRALAQSMRADFEAIDLLVNNAGVMGISERATSDGFEMQFGVNHLGHYGLTALLLPLLVERAGSRVVTVTSTARHFGRSVDPENPHLRDEYDPWRAYGQSKLANLHFALGLESRLRTGGARTTSLVAHPGLSKTDLQPHSVRETGGGGSQRFWQWLAATTGMPAARGALPQLRAATDPDATGGQLYAPRFGNNGSPVRRHMFARSRDQHSIETLFSVSERETGIALDVSAAVGEART